MNEINRSNKSKGLPTKISLIVRLGVAGYLLYTVYLLKNVPSEYKGGQLLFFIGVMLIFAGTSVFLIISSIRSLMQGKYAGGAMDNSGQDGEDC